MTTTRTLVRHRPFTYEGSIEKGVTVNQTSHPHITATFFSFMLSELKGKTVETGFLTATPSEGFGAWLEVNSPSVNDQRLTSGDASHIAAILVHEGYASYKSGGLTFKA